MRLRRLLLVAFLLVPALAAGQGVHYELPSWFAPSFLNFKEDVAEARKQGKHVMVFLHLDECPWCARMLEESFVSGENHALMQKHFMVVAVNVRGAQETVWVDGTRRSEQALTRHLKVRGTPTLVFLAQDGGVALQLPGYRDPRALRLALEFVQTQSYRKQDFAAYAKGRAAP